MAVDTAGYWLAPFNKVTAITPSDTTVFATPYRALYVLTTGTLAIVTTKGSTVALPVTAGQVLNFTVKQVKATGTVTATCVGLN